MGWVANEDSRSHEIPSPSPPSPTAPHRLCLLLHSPRTPWTPHAARLQPGRAGCGRAASRLARATGTYRAGAAVAELVEAKLQV